MKNPNFTFAKKAATLIIMGVSSITLTGCSLGFGIKESMDKVVESLDSFNETKDVLSGIIEEADKTDLNSEKELEALLNDIIEKSDKAGEKINAEFQKAVIVRVVDGDTIVVEFDKEQHKVRLIGIDTPESVASKEYLERTGKENTEEGKTASEYTKSILEDYKEVYLQMDKSDTDRYGRLLRYVWLEVPENAEDIKEISTKCLNAILIKNGYAEVATYKPDTKYAKDFEYIYQMSHGETYEDGDYYEIDR